MGTEHRTDQLVGVRAEDRGERRVGIDDRTLAIQQRLADGREPHRVAEAQLAALVGLGQERGLALGQRLGPRQRQRSEEHTSELQSLMRISYAVFCLKKKNKTKERNYN